MPPVFVVAAALLMSSEEFYQAWNTCSAGVPTRHVAYADACGISQVPWRSVLCLCPAPRPRPSRQDLALAILSMLPSGHPGRRPQRVHNIEANTGPQHPLSALHERRRRLPCKTRFRLAGCASTGRGLNPLDRFERFQVTSHSPFQDFACRKGGLCQAPVRRTRAGAGLSRPLYPSRRAGKLSSHPARRRPGRLHLEDYRHHGKTKVLTLAADEFIRRFLLHAVPNGFHRIRHVGFLANGHRTAKLALCRALLAAPTPEPPPAESYRERTRRLTGHALDVCPDCGGVMLERGPLPRRPQPQAPFWCDSS